MAASDAKEKTVNSNYGPSSFDDKKALANELTQSKSTIGCYKIQYGGKLLENDGIRETVSATLGPKAERLLYGKKPTKEDYVGETSKREDLVDRLIAVLNDPNTDCKSYDLDDPAKSTISLEELLGKEFASLYADAIKEERKSPAFRAAVFMRSLTKHLGDPWKEKKIIMVGGPPGAGKTTAGQDILAKTAEAEGQSASANLPENLSVEVDGSVGRKVSELEKLALKVALAKGYAGITDLHKKTKLDVKGKVEKAALKSKKPLSLIVPLTFANPKHLIKLIKYRFLKGFSTHFAEVKAPTGKENEFKAQTFKRGMSRAWGFWPKDKRNMDKNAEDLPCESKKYNKKSFNRGVKATRIAKKIFTLLTKRPSIAVHNVLIDIQLKKSKDGIYVPVPAKVAENTSEDVLRVTQAALKGFNARYPLGADLETAKDFFKRNAYLPEIIIKNQKKAEPVLQINPIFQTDNMTADERIQKARDDANALQKQGYTMFSNRLHEQYEATPVQKDTEHPKHPG